VTAAPDAPLADGAAVAAPQDAVAELKERTARALAAP